MSIAATVNTLSLVAHLLTNAQMKKVFILTRKYIIITVVNVLSGVRVLTMLSNTLDYINMDLRVDCKMRHENGNCLPCGGFCTAVSNEICYALHNAYNRGFTDCHKIIRKSKKESYVEV
jgi:hypothetical protein